MNLEKPKFITPPQNPEQAAKDLVLSLKDEINVLRALVEKRIDDLESHPNPNIDKALDTVTTAIARIESLIKTQAELNKLRGPS